jgi:hypothetical protein
VRIVDAFCKYLCHFQLVVIPLLGTAITLVGSRNIPPGFHLDFPASASQVQHFPRDSVPLHLILDEEAVARYQRSHKAGRQSAVRPDAEARLVTRRTGQFHIKEVDAPSCQPADAGFSDLVGRKAVEVGEENLGGRTVVLQTKLGEGQAAERGVGGPRDASGHCDGRCRAADFRVVVVDLDV